MKNITGALTILGCIAVCMAAAAIHADITVFSDPVFPYRIACKTEWVQDTKNDSTFILKNSASGKKTRFQLQKYPIDTSYDVNAKEWSRLRWAVNKELAIGMGQLIFWDTLASKKLGNYRAFELFAFFSQKSDSASGGTTIWWAEYSRWTDHDGFGYLASVIGDTTDVKTNYNNGSYRALMDSINISQLTTIAQPRGAEFSRPVLTPVSTSSTAWYAVSGRTLRSSVRHHGAITVKGTMKRLSIK